jgi:hypothetical protein
MELLKGDKYYVPIYSAALRKYQRAQMKLREVTTPDDGHYLKAFAAAPDVLYKHMQKMGFTWNAKAGRWQLYKRLSQPIWYLFENEV